MKRVLGFGRGEWDGMPWWEQRMYADELASYLRLERMAQASQIAMAGGDPASVETPEEPESVDLTGMGFIIEN